MSGVQTGLLEQKCVGNGLGKLKALNNTHLMDFITKYVEHCNPDSVYVCDDSDQDRQYMRNRSVELGEEKKLKMDGHTIHFDGPQDQGRDKEVTRYLLPPATDLGASLNSMDRDEGLKEIHGYLKDIMVGKQMYVLFFSLGPTNSVFSIPCVQVTDSCYVAHSEYILYRRGYEEFKKKGDTSDYFKFVHSAGVLEGHVSKNVSGKRIYMDLEAQTIFSTNTQYAGNTVGLKKLALRLAINKASKEGWLAEHMMLTAIHNSSGRKSYFAGAFPSACGKTSTAMLSGEKIVGDDIAYLRKINGSLNAANVECGIFGIIQDVNPKDDPIIWGALNTPGEVIVSNILTDDKGNPYWLGDGRETPDKGTNYLGEWTKDKKDANGNPVPLAHKNARYTVSLYALKNLDSELDNPEGVQLKGIIYGGRDSKIWPPVRQAFDWAHGVITMGASLESETTAATLGKEGVRQFSPMANLDFVSIPLGRYIQSHLDFVNGINNPPAIYAVNYFLKGDDGQYLTGMHAKRVWIKWIELRANNDVDAIETPIGFIPKYEDLKNLFKTVLDQDYTEHEYTQQFSIKVPANLEKVARIKDIYTTKVPDAPKALFEILDAQTGKLKSAQATHGDLITPQQLLKK